MLIIPKDTLSHYLPKTAGLHTTNTSIDVIDLIIGEFHLESKRLDACYNFRFRPLDCGMVKLIDHFSTHFHLEISKH